MEPVSNREFLLDYINHNRINSRNIINDYNDYNEDEDDEDYKDGPGNRSRCSFVVTLTILKFRAHSVQLSVT